ncbi:hypothetical protein BH09BAC5_BH09BAC5_12360 [soil metagenome]
MRLSLSYILRIIFLLLFLFGLETLGVFLSGKNNDLPLIQTAERKLLPVIVDQDSVQIKVGTFLGNNSRNYYGDSIGNDLQLIWKTFLGKGTTIVTAAKGVEEWFGAGWTGQPLIIKEKEKTYLIQGAFDHHLKKIDASTGEVIWNYTYDDILKGTGTIWVNDSAKNPLNRILILQGSRKGVQNSMGSPDCSSFRAVSFFTGKEVWRYNVKQTASYSRDVDASALIFSDTAYVGLENGRFISFDPGKNVTSVDSINRPIIFNEQPLYNAEDNAHHGGNLVTESSPVKIGSYIYITAGSGHVYGYNLNKKIIDWDFFIGSDMDGTPVVTSDSCLLVEVEKQYISGKGGVFKLNPAKQPSECVEWYFPTVDFHFSGWEGGVIGSVCVNDFYNRGNFPHLAAFTGIDGNLNVVEYDNIRKDTMVFGPDGKTKYATPVLKFCYHIGPSISTPVFSENKLVAAGYNGINLFTFNHLGDFEFLKKYPGNFEASPSSDHGNIFIASRDGYLYCFGDTIKKESEIIAANTSKENTLIESKDSSVLKPLAPSKKAMALSVSAMKSFHFLLIPAAEKMIAENTIKEALAVNEKKEIIPPAKQLETKQNVLTEPVPGNGNFHLITGVFKSHDNANNFVKTWQKRGMHAAIIISPKGTFYVSVADSNSEDELNKISKSIHSEYGADSWIFSREE